MKAWLVEEHFIFLPMKFGRGKYSMETEEKNQIEKNRHDLLILTSWMLENELRNQLCHFPKAADVNWDE